MASAKPAATDFPPMLDAVPRTEHIPQCFGWLYGYNGVLAIALSIGAAFGGVWKDATDETGLLVLLIGLALAGPVLLWWEFHRRAVRTVLVARGGVIGIYRRGRFAQTMQAQDLMVRPRNRIRMWRNAIILPLIGIFFLAAPLMVPSFWPLSVVGALFLIACVSGARTMFKLERCIIPGAKYPQDLMLDKTAMRRLTDLTS